MPAILRVKPEEIDTAEKRRAYTVSVVGCRQIGVLYAIAFAEAGYRVICVDADQSIVRNMAKGKAPFVSREAEIKLKRFVKAGQLCIGSDLKNSVSHGDLIVITTAAKIDDKKRADYSEVEKSCKQIGTALRKDTLVIYASIAGFGFTEGTVKELLENASGLKVGDALGFAYNPIYIPSGQPLEAISDQELKVAAADRTSLDTASTVLRTITRKNVKKITNIKTAETAALFSVAKRDADTALANELAIFCEHAGVDYFEVLKTLDLQEKSFSPTIEEEYCRDGAYFLLESGENLAVKLRLPALARQINEQMVGHAVNLIQDALRSCEKTLRRARVALIGTVQPQTAAAVLVQALEKKSTKLNLYDPTLSISEQASMARMLKKSLNEAAEGTDCIVIMKPLDQFKRLNLKKLHTIMKAPSALVDLTGIVEPQKVEKEGFIYRGLGREVGRK